MRQAIDIDVDLVRNEVQYLPESQALQYVARLNVDRDQYLHMASLVHRFGVQYFSSSLKTVPDIKPEAVYDVVWSTRAAATNALPRATSPSDQSGDEIETVTKLKNTSSRLSHIILHPPKSSSPEYVQTLEQLTFEKERLKRRLVVGNRSPAAQGQDGAEDFRTFARQLPNDIAVIDILRVASSSAARTVFGKGADDDCYEAFILRARQDAPNYSLVWVHLGDANEIDRNIDAWRLVSGNRGLTKENATASALRLREVGRELRQRVWDKLVDQLDGCKTIIIAPDGALAFVPWSALPGREPGSFIIDDFAIGVASHARQVADLLQKPAVDGNQLLVLGNIDYGAPIGSGANTKTTEVVPVQDDSHCEPLPETAKEATAIADLWRPHGAVVPLVASQATEERVIAELPQARYVHMATHGFFKDPKYFSPMQPSGREQSTEFQQPFDESELFQPVFRNPLALSGVVLAGANLHSSGSKAGDTMDGMLTGEKLTTCNLQNTELVVLSACETGLGPVAGGEGVFGLQRAFHMAGARTVIASLWRVDDNATRALMVEFYKNLWQRKLPRLEALRQAQCAMRKYYDPKYGELMAEPVTRGMTSSGEALSTPYSEGLSPSYWAGFVLSGDWR
jgi:CHAT domain-containing protein